MNKIKFESSEGAKMSLTVYKLSGRFSSSSKAVIEGIEQYPYLIIKVVLVRNHSSAFTHPVSERPERNKH